MKFLQALVIGLVVGAGLVVLWSQGSLDTLESSMWDLQAKYMARPGPHTDNIRLIFLDEESLKWGRAPERKWPSPWPREIYYHILKFCRRARAKVVVFDMLFPDPSPHGVADDQELGKGIAKSDCFVGTMFVGTDGGVPEWPENVPKPGLTLDAPGDWEDILAADRLPSSDAQFPIPEVAKNARMLGDVYGKPDDDAIFRRTHLVRIFDGEIVPSLALAAYLAPEKTRQLSISDAGELVVGDKRIPLDREGRAILKYRGPSQTHKVYSADGIIESELLIRDKKEPTIKPAELKDCYVFFGTTALALLDLKPTPVGGSYPGVEIHATALDNLLANDFVREIPYEATLGYSILAALLCSIAVRSSNRAWKTALVIIFLTPVPLLLSVAAYEYSIWLPVVLPEIGVVGAFLSTVVVKYAVEGRKKRFIQGAFMQYMNHEVVEELMKNPELLTLGGEKKVLSIFFSELAGFTSISENMQPEELTEWLNKYLTAMSDIIKEERGTIDKYEGDAIIAFWNAPLPQPDHASRAVRTALRCQQKLSDMRLELRKKAGTDVEMRIGLHTGPVMVGNVGSSDRFDYTMIGDAANLASRLEGLNKHFGTRTLISETTFEQVKKDVAAREISTVAVKGKTKPVKVFEPMSKLEFTKRRYMLKAFGEGLAKYYEGDFKEAHRLFSHTKDRDQAARWYAALCEELMKDPPKDWNGVWVMGEK